MQNKSPRRHFLQMAGGGLAALASGATMAASTPASAGVTVKLPPILNATEAQTKDPVISPPGKRVGFAIVGLGHLALEEVLPAFAQSRFARPVALVSGDGNKAQSVAAQYGIAPKALYSYDDFDRIAHNKQVEVIYIILPNSMHAEFTERAAKAGKHVLCEKPMATSVAECERMIAACRTAKVRLMIAYRSQYEPIDRAIAKMAQSGQLGALREFIAGNSQRQGDVNQWRHRKALAGGGALPDIGLYCLNAARFLSGEEPTEVMARVWSPPGDARFTEVEAAVRFTMTFPSGFAATAVSSYDSHESRFFRLQGTDAWAGMNPAFAYEGLKMQSARLMDGHDTLIEPHFPAANQFARELDHMARCVRENRIPHTPGEEGLQDHRIMEAIYQSAREGRVVTIAPPPGPTRGPAPDDGEV
ncbi:oxidoreductase [Luteibacter rhizovicinus DSM 16549]|uniref:Oxidoreductase n=1 Tax=Luteibacter rhizovicinus DSM 16549 TaxID=1440763 RepID=A0A1L3ETE1_9GAMM|nr:Gfo/Idh/MocA family oxidoreductase [Luteibacter rhizovicinus]APG04300.1 oxidoreductase [Luteibacter rhizovicinus DSM 16549]